MDKRSVRRAMWRSRQQPVQPFPAWLRYSIIVGALAYIALKLAGVV